MKLSIGDRVAIVAPASQFRGADLPLLDEGRQLLESWGLDVEIMVDNSHHFYLAGTDDSRAEFLRRALQDDRIKAIFCTRGGYGCMRLWPLLDRNLNPTPKLLVGFSDLTSLHLAFARIWPEIQLIHGPNIATKQLLGQDVTCERNRKSLRSVLFDDDYVVQEPVEFIRGGFAEGPLVGGCLSLICSASGTEFSLRARDSILFLEDVGESPFRIDRMLTQLKAAGIIEGVKGIAFGQMKNCTDPYNDLREVILDVLRDTAFPIAFGLPSGHAEQNISIALGSHSVLSSDLGEFHSS